MKAELNYTVWAVNNDANFCLYTKKPERTNGNYFAPILAIFHEVNLPGFDTPKQVDFTAIISEN